MNITIYKSILEITNGYIRDVEFVFERIRKGNSRELVERVRLTGDGELKKRLPVINFQGVFKERKDSGITEFSGMMPLDFDKFETPEELSETREKLKADKHTYALFTSPSGNGLKVIVRVPADGITEYKNYFKSLQEYYNNDNFDISSSNISRLCFESYDPEIYVNHDAEIYNRKIEPDFTDFGTTDTVFAVTSENRIIQNLLTWFNRKFGVPTGQRNSNLFKLAAALNAYGINQREALNVLLDFTQPDFSPTEITTICTSAYRNVSEHGTLFFQDTKIKERVEKHIRTGAKIKEIAALIPEANESQIEKLSHLIRHNQNAEDFLLTDAKTGATRLIPYKYKNWLEHHQFSKYFPSDSKIYSFIRLQGGLVEETSDKRIKDYVLKYLLSDNDKSGYNYFNFMANATRYFSPEYLSFLDSAEIKLEKDTKEAAYLYFENCVVKVTANEIKELDYLELSGYVWKNQVIKRVFKNTDFNNSEYGMFIWKVAGENEQRFNTLKSVIGYMLHTHKTNANNKAIILNDSKISENPNGRSGKGLFCDALKRMKKVSVIDGKDFDFNDSFPYQTVSTDCQILVFDDIPKNFPFIRLFSLITEGLTIEYKGQGAIRLTVQDSPKIIISTNYGVSGVGGSFDARKFDVEFSDFFHVDYTPLDFFGHMMFDDWSEKDWNEFDNFMIHCTQFYLQYGLLKSDFLNMNKRTFIANTSHDFYEYTKNHDVFRDGVKYSKKAAYDAFVDEFPDYKKWLSQKRFRQWIEVYRNHYKFYIYESANSELGRFFVITHHAENLPIETDKLPIEQQTSIDNSWV